MNINQFKQVVEKDKIIPLKDHKDIANSYWVTLQKKSGTVEGKIYLPLKETDKFILFEPGFPGGGSTQFEQLWLTKILENGYTVFLARHNGTLINGKYSSGYLNCEERQEIGKRLNQIVLGSKLENSITDWLNEPLVALETFVPYFSQITLCGHSFGPLALILSLIKYAISEPEMCKRINRVVSLSGSLGRFRTDDHPFLKVWYDHLNTDWARERVQIGDAKLNTDIFYQAHVDIHKDVSDVPNNIEFIAAVSWGDTQVSTDEIVQPIESLDFISALGRGYLIIDKKEFGDEKAGRMAHDMEALTADDLLNFISRDWLPKSQISVLEK
ncbi:MAG: hypothetical protein V1917_00845 [Candidatus Gottesmanbacteria bacterium]